MTAATASQRPREVLVEACGEAVLRSGLLDDLLKGNVVGKPRRGSDHAAAQARVAGGTTSADGARTLRSSARARGLGSRLLANQGAAIKACVLFLVVYSAQVAVVFLWGGPFMDRAAAWTARGTALVLDLLGAEGRADGDLVTSPTVLSVKIISECTAVFPLMVFISGVTAFPAPLRDKLKGAIVGVAVLLVINQARIVSLIYYRIRFPDSFETAHLVVWQSLMIFSTAMILLLWALMVRRRRGPRTT